MYVSSLKKVGIGFFKITKTLSIKSNRFELKALTLTSTSQSSPQLSSAQIMAEKGPPLPKFGDWDVNDPASAEGFTVIFNKARNEKKTGGTADSPPKNDPTYNKPGTATLGKPQSKKWFCCMA